MKSIFIAIMIMLQCGCADHKEPYQQHSIVGIWKAQITPEVIAYFGYTSEDLNTDYAEIEFRPDASLIVRAIDPSTLGTSDPQFMNGHYSISNTILRMSMAPGREEHQELRIVGDKMYLAPREFDGKVTNLYVRIKQSRFK